jgi:hypothetical protein
MTDFHSDLAFQTIWTAPAMAFVLPTEVPPNFITRVPCKDDFSRTMLLDLL